MIKKKNIMEKNFNYDEIEKLTKNDKTIVIFENFVYDVTEFVNHHPGSL